MPTQFKVHCGALTLYLDAPENREVAGEAGIAFTHANLIEKLRAVTDAYEALLTRL